MKPWKVVVLSVFGLIWLFWFALAPGEALVVLAGAVFLLVALFMAFGGLAVAIQKFLEFSDRLYRND